MFSKNLISYLPFFRFGMLQWSLQKTPTVLQKLQRRSLAGRVRGGFGLHIISLFCNLICNGNESL